MRCTPHRSESPLPYSRGRCIGHGPRRGALVGSAARRAGQSQDLAARNVDSFVGADRRLAVALDSPSPPYDLVVVDCGPTLGGLFVAAMFAADAVLLVSEPAANPLEGLPRTIALAASVQAQRSPDVRPVLFGVLPTSVARETRQNELLERRL